MKKTGFYIIKDKFFENMDDPYLKGNKEGSRPHYYCLEDKITGIYWMVPLSSKIEKFKKIIDKKERNGKQCDLIHILKLDDDRESAFLFQDMFPITDEYIERAYTIAGNPLYVTSEASIKILDKKARRVLGLIKRGVVFMPTQANVMRIYEQLVEKMDNKK